MGTSSYADTLDSIYAAALEPQRWTGALERLADHVGGGGAMLVCNNLSGDGGFITTGRLREDLGDVYVRHHTRNPVTLAAIGRPIGTPVLASSIVDLAEVRRSPLHADILAPQRIADQVILPIASLTRRGSTGGVGITLTERQRDDYDAVVSRFRRLVPHLVRAIDLSFEINRGREQNRRIVALIDAIPGAALLLDQDARIVCANAPAERLIAQSDGLDIERKSMWRLIASLPDQNRRLDAAFRHALVHPVEQSDEIGPAFHLARPSGRTPYLVVITALPSSSDLLQALVVERARLLVRIVDRDAEGRQVARRLRSAFGLTAAEARVAMLIGSGMSAPQASVALRVSVHTVRTHLARCFEKTAEHSQVGLARLVGSFSGPGWPQEEAR